MLGQRARIGALTETTDRARNRRTGVGALLGYLNGISLGVAYGIARPLVGRLSFPVQTLGVAVAAILSSNVPAALSGLTDPRQWSAPEWLEDVVPHLAYGVVTVWAFDNLDSS